MEYDKIRSDILEELGLIVVRYTNLQIDKEFENVCKDIDSRVKGKI